MADHAGRQRCHHRPTDRRQPALAAVPDDVTAHHQILHHIVFVTLETRSCRHRRLDDPIFVDLQPRRLGALAPALLFARLRRGLLARWFHPTRLDLGPTFQALQPRYLLAQGRVLRRQDRVLL